MDHQALGEVIAGPIRECLADRPVLVFGGGAGNLAVLRKLADCTTRTVRGIPQDLEAEFYSVFAHESALPMVARRGESMTAQVSAADPSRAACLYFGSTASLTRMWGRPVVGGRRREWEVAEHKDRQFGLDGKPVPRNQIIHEGLSESDTVGLLRQLRCHGKVMVQGVKRGSPAMASEHNAVITDRLRDSALDRLAARFAALPRFVVSPWDTGKNITYYGFSDGTMTAYLPPVEGLVLFSPSTGRLRAPGALTGTISPEELDRCATALAMVSRYVLKLGYVGAFGFDGVLTPEGLRIHDVNTRLCAGHRLYSESTGVPMMLVDLALRSAAGPTPEILRTVEAAASNGVGLEPIALWEDAETERTLRSVDPEIHTTTLRQAVMRRLAWTDDVCFPTYT